MANEEEPKQTIIIADSSKVYEDMSPFYLKETFSDIQLILSDKTIHAHKIVLAARCKYFESLLMQDPKQDEITLTDVPSKAFETILNYIYKGSIAIILTHGGHMFDILQLARKYSLKPLEKIINEKMSSIVNTSNVCLLLDKANIHGMVELAEICHSFIDKHISETFESDFLKVLTQKSMVKLLERDSFPAEQIKVFEIAANWCRNNTDIDNLVAGCVRLTELTQDEIFDVVWPSKIIDNDKLLNALATIAKNNSKTQRKLPARHEYDLVTVVNKNIATSAYNAKVISGLNTAMLLKGTEKEEEGAYHEVDDKNGITLDLSEQRCFNHVKIKMLGNNYSSYYIETSPDQQQWHKVIDYSQYSCKYVQNLYFEQQKARYIRLVSLKVFPLGKFEVSFSNKVPEIHGQIIYPNWSVVTSKTYIQVRKKTRDNFTVVLFLNQPYMISSMGLLLRFYRSIYTIEISINYKDWETVENKISEQYDCWHFLSFRERIVNFVKISGQLSEDKTWKDFKEFLDDFDCFYSRIS